MSFNIDEVISNYKIIDSIGTGGMGEVYKALQMNLDRIVAIKIIHSHLVGNREVLERFRKEARILAKLIHPNIVTIYDFMETDQNYCIVMEYVQGESISRIIKDQGPFDPVVSISMLVFLTVWHQRSLFTSLQKELRISKRRLGILLGRSHPCYRRSQSIPSSLGFGKRHKRQAISSCNSFICTKFLSTRLHSLQTRVHWTQSAEL